MGTQQMSLESCLTHSLKRIWTTAALVHFLPVVIHFVRMDQVQHCILIWELLCPGVMVGIDLHNCARPLSARMNARRNKSQNHKNVKRKKSAKPKVQRNLKKNATKSAIT